jgi:hypothetical protein
MGRARTSTQATATARTRAQPQQPDGGEQATPAVDPGLVDAIFERERGTRNRIQVSFESPKSRTGRENGYLEDVYDNGTCRVMLANGGTRRKFPLHALTVIPPRTYHKCDVCGVVSLTNGNDTYSEYHNRDCSGTLQEDGGCQARIYHGPGHQSTTRCRKEGPHEIHEAVYGSYRQFAEWRPLEMFSGFFDEAPEIDDV